jgi:hypothetical protein
MKALRVFVLSASAALLALSATAVEGQRKTPDKGIATETVAAKIARLVKQLGSSDFRTREAVRKELEAIGEPGRAAQGCRIQC